MKRLDRLLIIVLLLEVGVGALLYSRRDVPPRLPVPALASANPIRGDFEDLIANSKTPEDWHKVAEVYTAYGFYSESEACYDFLLARQPRDPELLFESGFVVSRTGRWEEANARFAAAIDAGYPTPMECWYFIGRNFLRAEQTDEAIHAFSRASELVSAQLELARLQYRAGDANGAMALLQPVLAKEPDKIGPNLLGYLCALDLGDTRSATRYGEHMADTTDRIFSPFYTQRVRVEASIPLVGYRRRFAASQERASENRIDEAEALLLDALRVEWNEFSVGALAQLATAKGDHERAISLLRGILDRRGPSSTWLSTLADSYAAMHDFSPAVDVLKQAIEAQAEEDLVDTFGKLARWSEILGRPDEADNYEKLHKLWEGKVAFWRADWKAAESHLSTASKWMAQSDEAWFYLAETYRRLNKHAESTIAYQRCLSLNPQHGGAHRGMAILKQE